MIRSIIVEDETRSRNTLSTLLDRYCPGISIEGAAENMQTALMLINEVQPELVFLDISIPGGSGFDLLEQLSPVNFEVIFTTAHSEYVLKAIKNNALDYLLKPINITELQQAVQKAEDKIQEKKINEQARAFLKHAEAHTIDPHKIGVPAVNGLRFFLLKKIIRLEANGSYTNIHIEDEGKVVSTKSIKEYEDILPQSQFLRVHNSHIISMHHVASYQRGEGGVVIMDDQSEVTLSRRRKKDFLDWFIV